MCGYTQQYTPSTSTTDYNRVSTTTTVTISGAVTVSTTPSSTSFGSGFSVLSFVGTLTSQVSGQQSYGYPLFNYDTVNLALSNGNSKIRGANPSNLVYTSGAAASVDSNGLSLTSSSGAQYVVQWNAATNQYQILSTTGASLATPILISGVSLSPISATSEPQSNCSANQVYTPPAVPSCPSGYTSVYAGDFVGPVPNPYVPLSQYENTAGNQLYFRPFVVSMSGTLVTSLSTYLLLNPGIVLHLRLGLFALNGSITAPSWTLLSMAPEQVLANSMGGVVEAPLPSAVTLQPGTYSIGVWFDQPVWSYTYWWWASPSPYTLTLAYTSLSATGQMPSYVVPQLNGNWLVSAAQTCVPATQTLQFSFCLAVAGQDGSPETLTGLLTTLATPLTNSFGTYYLVIAGNASNDNIVYDIVPGAGTNPAPQRLYIPTTTPGGVALDSTGLSFLFYTYDPQLYVVSSQQIPSTAAYQYVAMQAGPQSSSAVGVGAGEFSYQPYTAGSPLPDCNYIAPTYANVLTPPSSPPTMCSGMSALNATLGDTMLMDYANQAEGKSLPALTVYTNTFTVAFSGYVVNQITVDVLANTAQNLSVYMGVYSSTGALLGSSSLQYWEEVYDQQVVVNFTAAVALPAGKYYAALVTDGPLNIATSTVKTPSLTVSSITSGLPATMSLTASSAGAVPLSVTGCAPATHSVCSLVQYYTPTALSNLGYPMSTTYQYQGLMAGTANSDGSVTIQAANIHAAAQQRTAVSWSTSTVSYSRLSVAAPSKVYPSNAVGLDTTGVQLTSPTLGINVNLSYSATLGQYVDTWGTSAYPGSTIVTSSFTVAPIAFSGTIVPSCTLVYMPTNVSSTPAAPTCGSGSSAVTVGDYNSADYGFNGEMMENFADNHYYFVTSAVATGNSSVLLSQVGLSINNNYNLIAKFRFAVYDNFQNLLGSTNEVTAVNPVDATIVGVLTSPVLLQSGTSYYLAVWTDSNAYIPFTWVFNSWCGQLLYASDQPFPAAFSTIALSSGCAAIPLAGFGCSVAAASNSSSTGLTAMSSSSTSTPVSTFTSSPAPTIAATSTPPTNNPAFSSSPNTPASAISSSSSSTGSSSTTIGGNPATTSTSSSSNDVSLSKGAVAGIVIGCVVGTNLLLLAFLFLVCGVSRKADSTYSSGAKSTRPGGERGPHSRIELASTEPSAN